MTQKDVCKLLNGGCKVLRRYYERENLRGKVKPHVRYAQYQCKRNGEIISYTWRTDITFNSDKELDEYMEARLQNDKIVEYNQDISNNMYIIALGLGHCITKGTVL